MRPCRTLLVAGLLLSSCASVTSTGQSIAGAPGSPLDDVPETKRHVPILVPDPVPTRGTSATAADAALLEVTERILARADRIGFDQLSAAERNVAAVWGFEADMSNGGFDQYFFNASADFASAVPEALREMGAPDAAAIVEEAVGAFGDEGPAADQTDRQWQLARLGSPAQRRWAQLDRKFSICADDVSGLLGAYVAENAEILR